MSLSATPDAVPAVPSALSLRRLWRRELAHYPSHTARRGYLSLTVVSTISLYYMAFTQGAVGPAIMSHFRMSFWEFVLLAILSNGVGALASLATGLADRFGRANIVVVGMLASSALVTFALPGASSKGAFFAFMTLLGLVEGAVLVATPALVRDFSPQVGRAQAMGSWALGPVLGSLVVTQVASHTLTSHPDWRWQFYVSGTVGFVIAALAVVGLRELSPGLRDQLMVSERERALVEARAAGVDTEGLLQHHWRQMLRLDVLGSALAVSVFLLFYYALVGFLVVYFATVFGWSEARANALGNWFWTSNAISLVVAGLLSDRLRVRKPFMVGGVAMAVVGTVMFAVASTRPSTSYDYFALCFVLTAFGTGTAYVGWMAAFTETVERHNPAATATGLALWGWILRSVVTASLVGLTLVVPATSQLIDHGPRVQQIAAAYPQQVKILGTLGATAQALGKRPDDLSVQGAAIAKLTGLDAAAVSKALVFNRDHQAEIQTAQAIDPATLAILAANPLDAKAGAAAVAQVATKLHLTPAAAFQRLVALGSADRASLAFLQLHGGQLTAAGMQLASLTQVPAADLAYLGAHGADVVKAQHDQAGQWQTWWLVCIVGQLLLLPAAFLLAGRWSPRRAAEDARRHDQLVTAELQALVGNGLPTPRAAGDESEVAQTPETAS